MCVTYNWNLASTYRFLLVQLIFLHFFFVKLIYFFSLYLIKVEIKTIKEETYKLFCEINIIVDCLFNNSWIPISHVRK